MVDKISEKENTYLTGQDIEKEMYKAAKKDGSLKREKKTDRFGTSVSNGKDFLRQVDGRTWRARQMRTMYEMLVSDLGGQDELTTAQSEVCRRCAALATMAVEMESALALDDTINFDFDKYIILARTQAQLLRQVGMERRQKAVKIDDLHSYLEKKSS